MSDMQGIENHLETAVTTLCRCWQLTRADGTVMGFTDHDSDVSFAGTSFRAGTGMTARALSQTTGLSVDNSEALGALSDAGITEADIQAGRFDGAELRAWLVNWADPEVRLEQFRGSIGEISRAGGAFQAELRGLAEALNQPQGRVYQKPCGAVLGDGACQFDLTQPGYFGDFTVVSLSEGRKINVGAAPGFAERWFEAGRLDVISGAAAGLRAHIKNDRVQDDGTRVLETWAELRAALAVGDQLRAYAGCDKREETCKVKFNNFINYQGFPHVPGEDWVQGYPVSGKRNDGGSRQG